MKKLLLKPGFPVSQLDDFPEGCDRSKEGSLFLSPKSMHELTDGEYAHMCKARPDLMRYVQLLPESKPKPAPAPVKKAAPPPPPPAPLKEVKPEIKKKEEPKREQPKPEPKKEEPKSDKK